MYGSPNQSRATILPVKILEVLSDSERDFEYLAAFAQVEQQAKLEQSHGMPDWKRRLRQDFTIYEWSHF